MPTPTSNNNTGQDDVNVADGSISLEQDEIDSYRRLRSSARGHNRGSLIFSIMVLMFVLSASTAGAYFYERLNVQVGALQKQVETLSFENRRYNTISDQVHSLDRRLQKLQGEIDRVWHLASKEQPAALEEIEKKITAQKNLVDELQKALAGLDEKTDVYDRAQRTVQSLQASILSLESSREHSGAKFEEANKQAGLINARMDRVERAIDAIDKDRQRRARQLIKIERRLNEDG